MKKLLLGGIAIVTGIAIIWFVASGNRDSRDVNIQKAPEFVLQDYDGKDVALSDFLGRNVIVNSWAIWCPFCVEELREFALLQDAMGDNLVVIAVDRAESLDKQKEFTGELGISNDLIFLQDSQDSFYQAIGGFSMPETIFVDKSGNIVFHKRGPMKLDEMLSISKDVFNL